MADIDKALPNEVRKEFELPSEDEVQEQLVEQAEDQAQDPGPIDIQENEDGSVDINLDPKAATPEGGDEHYSNLAEFLPEFRQNGCQRGWTGGGLVLLNSAVTF